MKEYLKEKRKFQDLKNVIFSEDYDADQDQMNDFEIASKKVKDLNSAVEQCTKIRLNLKDDIEHFGLHQLQKSFLMNKIIVAEQMLMSQWVEDETFILEQEVKGDTDIADILKNQSSLRDEVILEQKNLLKKHKISTDIMYNLLLKTDSVGISLKDVNLDSMDFSQLLNNTEGVTSRYYNVAPLKYGQQPASLVDIERSRENTSTDRKNKLSNSMAIHRHGTLGLLPNYPSSVLPRNQYSSVDDLDVSQVIETDRYLQSQSRSQDKQSLKQHRTFPALNISGQNTSVFLASIKKFNKNPIGHQNRRFNLDYRQSPYVQSFVYDSNSQNDIGVKGSHKNNHF